VALGNVDLESVVKCVLLCISRHVLEKLHGRTVICLLSRCSQSLAGKGEEGCEGEGRDGKGRDGKGGGSVSRWERKRERERIGKVEGLGYLSRGRRVSSYATA